MRTCAQCPQDISDRHWNAKLCIQCFEQNRKKWHKEHSKSQNAKRVVRRAANPEKYAPAYERRKAKMRELNQTDPVFKARRVASSRKSKTGCTDAQFQQMMLDQEGKCAICQVVLVETTRGPCVDHCHKTGEIRGLLCSKCNSGIGQLQDSVALVQRAAEYLAQYNSDHRNGWGLA